MIINSSRFLCGYDYSNQVSRINFFFFHLKEFYIQQYHKKLKKKYINTFRIKREEKFKARSFIKYWKYFSFG